LETSALPAIPGQFGNFANGDLRSPKKVIMLNLLLDPASTPARQSEYSKSMG
jgi:hypothetical protein